MRSLSLWLLGPVLQEIEKTGTLIFVLHLALVQAGARLAGMAASLKWAAWSLGMAWLLGGLLALVAYLAGFQVPLPVAATIDVVVLALALRLNYFGSDWKRAWLVAIFSTAVTMAIVYFVARVLERFVVGW
jgi:hypothetical protein